MIDITFDEIQEHIDKGDLKEWANGLRSDVPDTNVGDTVSRQAAIDMLKNAEVSFSVESDIDFTKHQREVQEIIDGVIAAQTKAIELLPSAPQVEIVRCKDCKHFKRDYFSNVCGVPIITCHNICTKWNGRDGGCVTREDGYCFLGERRENE